MLWFDRDEATDLTTGAMMELFSLPPRPEGL